MGHLNLPKRIHGKPKEEGGIFQGATKTYFDLKIGKEKVTIFEYKWNFPNGFNPNFVTDGINRPYIVF